MEKTKGFSKAIVSLIIFLNTVFTIAVLYIFLTIGQEPMALITAWFAFTTGELFLLATIKKKEITVEIEEEEYYHE